MTSPYDPGELEPPPGPESSAGRYANRIEDARQQYEARREDDGVYGVDSPKTRHIARSIAELLRNTAAFGTVDIDWLELHVGEWSPSEVEDAIEWAKRRNAGPVSHLETPYHVLAFMGAQRLFEEASVLSKTAEVTQTTVNGVVKKIDPPLQIKAGQKLTVDLATGEPKVDEHVDHPSHYGGKDDVYETIKVLRAWLSRLPLSAYQGGVMFNVIKYLSRAGVKGDLLEDLRKARFYLNELIETVEKK